MSQARVVDLETGKDVAQGERGELWVRGLNITKGYYRNPEATKGTFSSVSRFYARRRSSDADKFHTNRMESGLGLVTLQ